VASKPDAIQIGVSGALARLNETRRQALSTPSQAEKPDYTAELAADLRTALAVRGWVSPQLLLPKHLDEETLERTLDAVAPDVETSFGRHPGKWYMSVPVRRRVIASRDRAALRAELDQERCVEDRHDPVRTALRTLLDNSDVELKGRSTDELRAFENAADWLGDERAGNIRDRTAALAAESQRTEEVKHLSGIKMIGRVQVKSVLTDFLSAPYDPASRLAAVYLHGVGGAGKSTLLGHVERQVRDRDQTPIIVHLDFDRAELDPSDPVTLDLALFQQLSAALPEAAAACRRIASQLESFQLELRGAKAGAVSDRSNKSGTGARRRRVSKADTAGHSMGLESLESSEGSERDSILYGALRQGPGGGSIDLTRRPLALILDTVEAVLGRGEASASELASWLDGLVSTAGASDVRAIIAGRDPIAENSPLDVVGLLARRGHRAMPEIALTDLDEAEAEEVLKDAGIEDETVAKAAAAALPRNPLVLRVAGEVFKKGTVEVEKLRDQYRAGRVDPETARQYLAQRVIAHLPDLAARRYALAAIILPEVTEAQIREIVMPVVDGPGTDSPPRAKAGKVFEALSHASWLIKRSHDGKSFTYHPPLRALVLKLIDATADHGRLRDHIRAAAITWHRRRKTKHDRAFVLYHRLMGGQEAVNPEDRELLPLLNRFLVDLPKAARESLDATEDTPGKWSVVQETDHEWRAYVEGIGERDGQGEKLVRGGRAEQALALYRQRPTRAPGLPPTFFIQALADSSEWDTNEVNAAALVEEVKTACEQSGKRLSGTLLSRIYWLTRYELLRHPKPLAPDHEDVLRMVADRVSPDGAFLVMPSMIAAAEAFSRWHIAPETWVGARESIHLEPRFYLVHALSFNAEFAIKPNLEDVVVTQKNWARRVMSKARTVLQPTRQPAAGPGQIDIAQRGLSALHSKPYAVVAKETRGLRRALELTFGKDSREAAILLLRGASIEFHRPLRSALSACLLEAASTKPEHAVPIWTALESISRKLSIRPKEFDRKLLRVLVASNPAEWLGSYISYVDRSRLLPELCQQLARIKANTVARKRLVRVARAFAAWDRALCRGGSSAW
jgi:hypothetical protein